MAVSQISFSAIAMVLVAFSLIGASLAAEAPAPGPTSAASGSLPSLAVGFFAAAALLFGSALRI